MALTFRYRYVDFGTSFTGDPRIRPAASAADSPSTLFANELVTDVGGTCWGSNEPLAIIDHHFSVEGQFPSASAAVLHKAKLIRDKFGRSSFDMIWLVSHKQPDFDAFCSMYLARRIIEAGENETNWETYGLHADAWVAPAARSKINWFDPDLSHVSPEHRWPLLLAAYASALDGRRRISCPRQRQLNSVLLAALKRGRDYLSETSGATEFFEQAGTLLQQEKLNPLFDSVLENSPEFAPELAMLDPEAEAYQRDVRRARKSVVYLPEAEAPSPRFFKTPREVTLQEHKSAEVNAQELLLADTFRIPTSGIYLRDPECRFFQEWARLDLDDSPLQSGFEFTAIAHPEGRSEGTINRSDYILTVDPERSNGRHLFTVWSRLETKEVEALRTRREASVEAAAPARSSEQHSATLGTLLADPWFGGQSSFGTLVRTPARGTLIGPPGTRSDLRDDPIVEEVRTELEGPVYSAESLVAGPQAIVLDLSASSKHEDLAVRQVDLNTALEIPPPAARYFRFATVRLRADVPIASQQALDRQIGDTLWQVLYPEMPGATPPDFAERHLIVTANAVGVWGDRGIAVAHKRPHAETAPPEDSSLQEEFSALVSLLRDIDRLTTAVSLSVSPAPNDLDRSLDATAVQAEQLVTREAELKHTLTLPGRDLLRHFAEVINADQLFATLHDLSRAAVENLRRRQLEEQQKRMDAGASVIAKIRSRLEWLEVLTLGLLAVVVAGVLAWQLDLSGAGRHALLLLAGPIVIAVAAFVLKPWKRKAQTEHQTGPSTAILVAVAVACLAAWLAGLLWAWGR